MKPLKHYIDKMTAIVEKASEETGIKGSHFAWIMMVIGVLATSTMTYSLCLKGMSTNALWQSWVELAAFFPVALMEGSALALTYGRHFWFRSTEQRSLANFASWVIWIVLALTSVCHFALGNTGDASIQAVLSAYASYVLPLAIVAIPALWKRLYDLDPQSKTRTAILESEAELMDEIIGVQRQQNRLMIESYRDSLDTEAVRQARAELFERASIEHAKIVAGFIEGSKPQTDDDTRPEEQEEPSEETALVPQPVNGIDRTPPKKYDSH
jgi:hypothetical protein